MKVLPVVGRELRAIARRPSAYWVRSGSALAAFVALGYVALIGAVGLTTANQGRSLFGLLSLGAFAFCILAGVRGTSDVLSQEKREGTLGLLFLTDLKGYDVVLGKLVSVSINSIYGILAVAPPLALAFIMGGTSSTQFLLMIAFLFNTLFFSLAVGIFISAFSQQERPAMGATLAIIFVILAMPFAIATAHTFGILELWEVLDPGFVLPSPAFAYWTIKDPTLLRIYFDEVLLSMAFAHLAGWLCIVVASASIARRAHSETPRGRLATWFERVRHDWAYGKIEQRRSIRATLLDQNAFAWLAGRDRLKRRYAWVFLVLLGALWTAARWKAPEVMEEWPITLFSLWFLHLFFKVWVASEVAARFIDDRRNNASELLLTTPLKLREFAGGQRLALFRQFGTPLAFIVILSLISGWRASDSSSYMIRSLNPMQFFVAGLIHLAVDLYAVHWIAIWRSLHLRGTNRTITQTIFLVVLLPMVGWFLLWQGSWLIKASGRRGGPSAEEILWTWTILCVVYDLILAFVARNAFFRDFREIATKAFDKPAPLRWRFWRVRTTGSATMAPHVPKRRVTISRKFGIAFAVLLLCVSVGVSIRRNRLDADVRARLAEIRNSNLPLNPTEVARWRGGPRKSGGTLAVLREASKVYSHSFRHPELPKGLNHWNSRERLPEDFKQRANNWLKRNATIFRVLEQLPDRAPGGGGYDDLSRGPMITEDLALILQLKARVEIEDDPAAAAKTINILLHLARGLQGQPFGGFGASRKAMQSANELLERAALQGGFSEAHWREWKLILEQLDPVANLRESLVAERAEGLAMFSLPVDALYQRFGRQFGDFPALFSVGWSIRRFFGQDKAEMIEYLDYMQKFIADSVKPFPEIRKSPRRFAWRAPSLGSSTFITPQLLPAFDFLFAMATERLAYKQILMTACDVEIYRATHGRLPKDIADLPLVRIDPYTGNKVRYIFRGDEYTIYAAGEDMVDDGGVRAGRRRTGDLSFNCGNPPEASRDIKNP